MDSLNGPAHGGVDHRLHLHGRQDAERLTLLHLQRTEGRVEAAELLQVTLKTSRCILMNRFHQKHNINDFYNEKIKNLIIIQYTRDYQRPSQLWQLLNHNEVRTASWSIKLVKSNFVQLQIFIQGGNVLQVFFLYGVEA